MEIIGHVNNIVYDVTNVLDGEISQIPIGGWCGDRHGVLIRRQSLPQILKKSQVIGTIVRAACWDAGDVRSPRVFPVKIYTIEVVVLDELVKMHWCKPIDLTQKNDVKRPHTWTTLDANVSLSAAVTPSRKIG